MNAYFNELSFTPYADRKSVKDGLQELIACLKQLDQFGIKNVMRSNTIDNQCLIGNESYLKMLNDKKLIDEDMKSVLINRMETLEPEDELENRYLTLSMKYNNQNCKGLGWASNELENIVALSLHSEVWDRTYYNVKLTRLNEDAMENVVNTTTRNIATLSHINIHHDFLSSCRSIPHNGKVLSSILGALCPNLVFSKAAVSQIREQKSEDTIAQIYFRLREMQRVAAIFNQHCCPASFTTKASPESDTRKKLFASRLTFEFGSGKSYLCSWHLRFTPGAGRIHFFHEPSEKKIYVGYIGVKIQAE